MDSPLGPQPRLDCPGKSTLSGCFRCGTVFPSGGGCPNCLAINETSHSVLLIPGATESIDPSRFLKQLRLVLPEVASITSCPSYARSIAHNILQWLRLFPLDPAGLPASTVSPPMLAASTMIVLRGDIADEPILDPTPDIGYCQDKDGLWNLTSPAPALPPFGLLADQCPRCSKATLSSATVVAHTPHAIKCPSSTHLNFFCTAGFDHLTKAHVNAVSSWCELGTFSETLDLGLATSEGSCLRRAPSRLVLAPALVETCLAALPSICDVPTMDLLLGVLNCNGIPSKMAAFAALFDDTFALLFLQEVGDVAALPRALPDRLSHIVGSQQEGHRRLVICWDSESFPSATVTPAADTPFFFVCVGEGFAEEPIALANVHLSAAASPKDKKHQLDLLSAALRSIGLDLVLIGGDFNTSYQESGPLYKAINSGPLSRWKLIRAVCDAPTHFQRHCAPSQIDHVFSSSILTTSAVILFNAPSDHRLLSTQISVASDVQRPMGWKCVPWKRFQKEELSLCSSIVDVLWGYLQLAAVPPDAFVGAALLAASCSLPTTSTRRQEGVLCTTDLQQKLLLGASRELRARLVRQGVPTDLTSITGSTAARLGRPAKSLQPYSGLAPDAASLPHTPSLRKQEITNQASDNTRARGVILDEAWLARDNGSTTSSRGTLMGLPADDWATVMRMGFDPDMPSDRAAVSQSLSSSPLVTKEGVFWSLAQSSSSATAIDNISRLLLANRTGGIVGGVHRMLTLTSSGVDSIILDCPQYGLFKRGPTHLVTSFRPLVPASGVISTESRLANRRIGTTSELTGSWTSEVYSYRAEIQPQYLALTLRAAVAASIDEHGAAWLVDWDESDAFLRVDRGSLPQLLVEQTPGWDFGPWAQAYYGRLRIRPVSGEGLCPPYVTGEGFNQGDPSSGACFQSVNAMRSRTIEPHDPVILRSGDTELPSYNFVFSDDRRLLHHEPDWLAELVRQCTKATVGSGGLVNLLKLDLIKLVAAFDARTRTTRVKVEECCIEGLDLHGSLELPMVVGIPVLSMQVPPKKAASLVSGIRSLGHSLAEPPNLLFALRCLSAFGYASVDYVSAGCALPPYLADRLTKASRAATRSVFNLPPWTPTVFLELPLNRGGCSSANHLLRGITRLGVTYLQGAYSRHPTVRASVSALLTTSHSDLEANTLTSGLAELGVSLTTPDGSSSVTTSEIDSWGDPLSAPEDALVVFASDGAAEGDNHGGGGAFWTASLGIFFTFRMGTRVAESASATEAEWVAKLHCLRFLSKRRGPVLHVMDNIHIRHSNYNNHPAYQSLLYRPYQEIMQLSSHLDLREVWVASVHTEVCLLEDLSNLPKYILWNAHNQATRGCARASPFTVPFASLLDTAVLGWLRGSLITTPRRTLQLALDSHLVARFEAAYPGSLLCWDPSAFNESIQKSTRPLASHRQAYRLRSMSFPRGEAEVLQSCSWCGASSWSLVKHARQRCPALFEAAVSAAAWLVSKVISSGKGLSVNSYFHTEYSVASTSGLVRVGVAWEGEPRVEDAPSLFISMSGLTRETGRAMTQLGLSPDFLSSLVPAFLRWTEPRSQRSPVWAQHRVLAVPSPTREILRGTPTHGAALCPELSFVVGFFARAFRHWELLSPAPLSVDMPAPEDSFDTLPILLVAIPGQYFVPTAVNAVGSNALQPWAMVGPEFIVNVALAACDAKSDHFVRLLDGLVIASRGTTLRMEMYDYVTERVDPMDCS